MNVNIEYKDVPRENNTEDNFLSPESQEEYKRQMKKVFELGLSDIFYFDGDNCESTELEKVKKEIYYKYILMDKEIPQELLDKLKELKG